MRPEIRRLTTEQLTSLLTASKLSRTISSIHVHHTWRPTRSQFKGLATIEAMRNFHVNTNRWDDIAQHLTIDPQGLSWTGRNWNLPPASQAGRNGTRQEGPFMIEIVGDFDGRDLLDGPQRQAVVDVVAAFLDVCELGTGDIFFHRELGSTKTCPGTGVEKQTLVSEIAAATNARGARSALPFARELLLGHDVAADVGEAAPGYEAWEVPEQDLAAQVIQDEARARVRAAMGETRDLPTVLERARSEWQHLRPYVVNLSKGRLSEGGEFEMPPGAIEGIVDAIEQVPLEPPATLA